MNKDVEVKICEKDLTSVDTNPSIIVDHHEISNSCSEKLLAVTIDNKQSFDEHVSGLCTKASQKLHVLARISPYMDIIKRCTTLSRCMQGTSRR